MAGLLFLSLFMSVGVAAAVATPLVGIYLDFDRARTRAFETTLVAQREELADQRLTIEAYREMVGEELVLTNA